MREAERASDPAPERDGSSEAWREEQWSRFLAAELAAHVRVVYTRSRKTPVATRALRAPRGALEVRLHRDFAAAPEDVRAALVSWIRSGRRAPRATARLDAFIGELLRRSPPVAALRALAPAGHHHDLARIAEDLYEGELAAEFQTRAERPRIGWGRRSRSRTRSSLRLGSYDGDGRIVRIHPVLDQPAVPEWFVRYVLFHELLHAVFPVRRGADDRWIHHGREFRRRERAYADHRAALAWERAHLVALIRSARTGAPMPAAAATAPKPRAHASSEPPRDRAACEPSRDRPARAPQRDLDERAPQREGGVLRALQRLLFPD